MVQFQKYLGYFFSKIIATKHTICSHCCEKVQLLFVTCIDMLLHFLWHTKTFSRNIWVVQFFSATVFFQVLWKLSQKENSVKSNYEKQCWTKEPTVAIFAGLNMAKWVSMHYSQPLQITYHLTIQLSLKWSDLVTIVSKVFANSGPSQHLLSNQHVTSGHLSLFREAVSALFYQCGTEALPLAQIRRHVMAKTTLTEPEIASCVKIMLNQNKMLETANYFCLI